MRIEILSECDSSTIEKVHEAFDRLLPQLSSSAQPLSREEIQKLLAQECLHLVCALDEDDRILGMLSLVVFDIPTGRRAWVEDVVTDQAARGQGVGQSLVNAAVEHARELGAKTVDLTSRPTREAANRLYPPVGFLQRETNVYRKSF